MTFVEKLDRLLVIRKVKRADLADSIGISATTISAWGARGTLPSIDIIFKIAAYFRITVYELMHDVDGVDTSTEEKILKKLGTLPHIGENPALLDIISELRDVSASDLSTVQAMVTGLANARRRRRAVVMASIQPVDPQPGESGYVEHIAPDSSQPAGLKNEDKSSKEKRG